MQQAIEDLLRKRKDRSIAIILSYKEREIDPQITAMSSTKLRKVVLDQLNDFYDMCRDVIDSLDTGDFTLNEEYLTKIDELHSALVGNSNGRSERSPGPAPEPPPGPG